MITGLHVCVQTVKQFYKRCLTRDVNDLSPVHLEKSVETDVRVVFLVDMHCTLHNSGE